MSTESTNERRSRVLAVLTAMAHAHGCLPSKGRLPDRYLDERYRVSVAYGADSHAFELLLSIIDGHGSGQRAVGICGRTYPAGRFVCEVTHNPMAAPYDGPLPEVTEGELDEAGFLALAERCIAFYAGQARTEPVTPQELHRALVRIAGQTVMAQVTTDQHPAILASAARPTMAGWEARFTFIPPSTNGTIGAYLFSIMRVGVEHDPANGATPGFAACVTGKRDAAGRYLLQLNTSCIDYDGPVPVAHVGGRNLIAVLSAFGAYADFYAGLPAAGSMPVA